MTFDPHLADRRFGTGLSPDIAPPVSVDAVLSALSGPDAAAARHPIPAYADVTPSLATLRALNRQRAEGAEAEAAFMAARTAMHDLKVLHLARSLARGVTTQDGFRERLTRFWADHFTTVAKNGYVHHLVTPYVEEAIRPRLTGRFGDLLVAAVTHPMMVLYLDQTGSVGPNSPVGTRTGRGLNENLAREVLELHTIGAGGPYTQTDVRELAELLTGLSRTPEGEPLYRPRFAEPGRETVLGTTFSDRADISTIEAALQAIAVHPATARHIAGKLSVHFVSDTPDASLVDAMADTFAVTGGDLAQVYEAMLRHPAAWMRDAGAKVLTPYDFLQSSLRALAFAPDGLDAPTIRRHLVGPMRTMGQDWERPPGPDGWAEEAEAWITPQGMAGRITWAMQTPGMLMGDLPDPRAFVTAAMGPDVPDDLAFAARAAEDKAVGIGLILTSAAFNRRG